METFGRMIRYAIIRVLSAIPILLVLLGLFFVITHVLPGDPATWLAGEQATPEAIEAIRHEMGLDRPMYVQILDYFRAMLQGDLGRSYASHRPVMELIGEALPTTLELAISATITAVLIGLPSGILGALYKDRAVDQVLRVLNFSCVSIPVFWLGIILQIVLALDFGILPVAGRIDYNISVQRITGMLTLDSLLTLNLPGIASSLRHLFMPALSLGLLISPGLSRISRGAMLSELSEDYITTAKAKGCSSLTIVYKYALRHAMIPVLTVIGMSFVGLMGGVVLVETLFSLPGLGRLLVTAAYGRDYFLLQGCVLVIALVILIGTTGLDLIYAKLDPRVTL